MKLAQGALMVSMAHNCPRRRASIALQQKGVPRLATSAYRRMRGLLRDFPLFKTP